MFCNNIESFVYKLHQFNVGQVFGKTLKIEILVRVKIIKVIQTKTNFLVKEKVV